MAEKGFKEYTMEDIEGYFPNIAFLNVEAMKERMSEETLSEVDLLVIQKVLENFVTGGEAFADLEEYAIDETVARSIEVLYKLRKIKGKENKGVKG